MSTTELREKIKQACMNQFEVRMGYTLLFAAEGRNPAAIAQFLGIDFNLIKAILEPQIPPRFTNEKNGKGLFELKASERLYNEDVKTTINGILATGYNRAIAYAEQRGRHQLLPELNNQFETYWDSSQEGFRLPVGSVAELVISICALTDARIALGIEPFTKEYQHLMLMIQDFYDIAEKLWNTKDLPKLSTNSLETKYIHRVLFLKYYANRLVNLR